MHVRTYVADGHESGVDSYPYGQFVAVFEPFIPQFCRLVLHINSHSHGARCMILHGNGIAKKDQETVAYNLVQSAVVTVDDLDHLREIPVQ